MKKIYLTGIPCTGKTSLINKIIDRHPHIKAIRYSDILQQYIIVKNNEYIEKSELRKKSSEIIEPEDINVVDDIIIRKMCEISQTSHVILDSHPVTTEDYGFRVTPFKRDFVQRADFDILVCLFASPMTIIGRYQKTLSDRKLISMQEVETSMYLQNSIAVSYGMLLDKPVYFYNTDTDINFLVESLCSKIMG